ncbi:DNA/RNA nuclease SfsA [Anaerocolumna sp.]|uniref:DNA/RNA nuclease SfsA n=1 Tax=Anaerocolumna sp. TaxID=2041569 RepID=UPI0028AA3DFB|nr:DNA/RNA nuclease SfsA [Anaerocolumna sp.]
MKYSKVQAGIFKSRPNRFIAYVEVDGEVKTCHVKNTGRCKELLIPGVTVYLEEQDNPNRKTKYDLIGVQKGNRMINMDSQAPNKVVYEWIQSGGLFSDIKLVKTEKTYGNSRFDLYVETENKKIYIEVKGVTLEEKGIVRFPDAPTERGVKHVKELISCMEEGYEAYIIFVVQMKDVKYFEPNDVTHPAFGQALREAEEKGVHILAVDCDVEADKLNIRDNVMVKLQ